MVVASCLEFEAFSEWCVVCASQIDEDRNKAANVWATDHLSHRLLMSFQSGGGPGSALLLGARSASRISAK